MKCSNCQNEVLPGMKFCPSCGQALNIQCPHCGANCKLGESFCHNCGKALKEQSIQLQRSRVDENFESVRRHVTVLFTDIKGSTSLIQHLDPEEAKKLLNPAVREMINAIYQYAGTIIHTAGDGITAIFGAPKALEDHALRACLAALAMRTKIKSMNSNIHIRVGLHSGEVLLETSGDSHHLEYDIVGPSVNLAARMEQTAEPDTIQISQQTYKLVEKNADVIFLGSIQVKGFQEEIKTYALKTIKETKSLYSIKSRPTLAPFVGREKEIKLLKKGLSEAKSQHGNVIAIEGEAGQGKSRLITEFCYEYAKDFNILITGGFAHATNINLYPVAKLLRNILRIKKSDTKDNIQAKLKNYANDSPYFISAILNMMQIHTAETDAKWDALAPQLKRRYMFKSTRHILAQMALKQPIILIIEDLHWVDSDTEEFIDSLIHHIAHMPLLLLLTYRTGYQDHWVGQTHYRNFRLASLTKKAKNIVNALLGNDFSLNELKKKLIDKSSGNPFYIEEMVKGLVQDGVLIGEAKNYKLNPTFYTSHMVLPESIFAILQTKIDKLPDIQKKIVQAASVIGENFSYNLLASLMNIDQKELRSALNDLNDHQYIYETQLYPEPRYSFKHALIQEVTYNGLLKTLRRSLHQNILTIMEKYQLDEQSLDDLQFISNHAFLGEVWDKASDYCLKAAEKLYAINALKLAIQFYDRVLKSTNHLTNTEQLIDLKYYVYSSIYILLMRMGQFEQQTLYLNQAIEFASKANDKVKVNILMTLQALNYLGIGKTQQAFEIAMSANKIAKEENILQAIFVSDFAIALISFFLGNFTLAYDKSSEAFQKIELIKTMTPLQKFPLFEVIEFYLSWSHAYTGDFAYNETKNGLLNFSMSDGTVNFTSLFTYCSIGMHYSLKGQFEESLIPLNHALHQSIELETILPRPIILAALGYSLLQLKKPKEAKKHILDALKQAKWMKFVYISALSMGYLCECLMLLGDYDTAKELITSSLQMTRERQLHSIEPWLIRLNAEINLILKQQNHITIKKEIELALSKAKEIGLRPQVAHCHLAMAKLYKQQKKIKSSKKEILLALTEFEKLGMYFWVNHCNKMMGNHSIALSS